jgi:hypothetical protein
MLGDGGVTPLRAPMVIACCAEGRCGFLGLLGLLECCRVPAGVA